MEIGQTNKTTSFYKIYTDFALSLRKNLLGTVGNTQNDAQTPQEQQEASDRPCPSTRFRGAIYSAEVNGFLYTEHNIPSSVTNFKMHPALESFSTVHPNIFSGRLQPAQRRRDHAQKQDEEDYNNFYLRTSQQTFDPCIERASVSVFANLFNTMRDKTARRLYDQTLFAADMLNPREKLSYDPVEKLGELLQEDGFALLPIAIFYPGPSHQLYGVCYEIELFNKHHFGHHPDSPKDYMENFKNNRAKRLSVDKKADLDDLFTTAYFRRLKSLQPKANNNKKDFISFFPNPVLSQKSYSTPQIMGNCQYTAWTEALKIAARLEANKIEGFTPKYLTEEILGVKKEAVERTAWNFVYKMVKKYRASLDDRPMCLRLKANPSGGVEVSMTERKVHLKERFDQLSSVLRFHGLEAQAALDARLNQEQQERAAKTIQRRYRAYRAKKIEASSDLRK